MVSIFNNFCGIARRMVITEVCLNVARVFAGQVFIGFVLTFFSTLDRKPTLCLRWVILPLVKGSSGNQIDP